LDVGKTFDDGRHAETMAAAFLCLNGYVVTDRNVRFGPLEIDLVARRGDVVAVVEVKYRRRGMLGGAGGSVGREKQRFLETAAVRFLRSRRLAGVRVRFDVVLIEPSGPNAVTVRHIQNAFRATGRYAM
jgi:putative endonuclease